MFFSFLHEQYAAVYVTSLLWTLRHLCLAEEFSVLNCWCDIDIVHIQVGILYFDDV